MYTHVYSSYIHNTQNMESAYVPIYQWMDKENVMHIHNEVLINHKEEWNYVICRETDETRDRHFKWN
jgi:hypothetical protein